MMKKSHNFCIQSRDICLTGRGIVELMFECNLLLKLRDIFYKWGNSIQF